MPAGTGGSRTYAFGSFRLDAARRLLVKEGEPVALQPKTIELLVALLDRHGEVVEKDELMHRLWPDTVVEESNLSQNIYILRKVLGADPDGQRYIQTVPKRGYRFVAPLDRSGHGGEDIVLERHVTSRVVIEEEVEDESAARPRGARAGSRYGVAAYAGAALLAGVALVALIVFSRKTDSGASATAAEPFQLMTMSRVTDIGSVYFPAISPDGRYVAYVLRSEEDQQSIWLKNIATGSATLIVADDKGLEAPVFSRDGNYVFYNRNGKGGPYALYQVPVLGGAPRRLVEDVWGAVAVSPDGAHLAFVRAEWNKAQSSLMLVDADGTHERTLAVRRTPDYFGVFGVGPAWSPDGKRLLTGAGNAVERYENIVDVDVATGAERPLCAQHWHSVGQIAWTSDGRDVVLVAKGHASAPQQVMMISVADGAVRRVTNDLSDYAWIGLAADSRALVAARMDLVSNIWVAPRAGRGPYSIDAARARQVSFGVGKKDGYFGIAWTPDGRIIYSSDADRGRDLWIVDADGGHQRQLTVDAGDINAYPAVSPDGRYIVLSSNRGGDANIWRIDADGRNPRQLTRGKEEYAASFSSDGRFVVYESNDAGTWSVWRVPIDGGPRVRLTERYSSGKPAVSPDGRLIAYEYFDDHGNPPWRIAVMPFAGGAALESFPSPFRMVRWTPDGHALSYIQGTNTLSNIWSRPLDGGAPRQLTAFGAARIFWFDWSRDGRWLACARGAANSDAVLIRDFK